MAASRPIVALLRGINLGPNRRIPMAALREVLTRAGFEGVRTYVQSGNVVLSSDRPPAAVARELEGLIAAEFGFEVPVVARSRDELASVVARNPLGDVAENPKRYQVTFLESELPAEVASRLEALRVEPERLVIDGREIYTWHPDGVARSKLWAQTASSKGLGGVAGTARNWTTVTTLLAMADGE
jgi:uncharacterized protein (DUF1697 family)